MQNLLATCYGCNRDLFQSTAKKRQWNILKVPITILILFVVGATSMPYP